MKTLKILTSLLLTGCTVYTQDLPIAPCQNPDVVINPNFTKAAELQALMERIVNEGIPGCAIAVYSNEGWWASAAGVAKIENKMSMANCHLQYLQSVSKTLMAVVILKLYEQGRIDLDHSFTEYLPANYSRSVSNAEKITVRMLLNHTSGIPEYNFDPNYVAHLLQHPDYVFDPHDYLKYIQGKPLDFEPGSKYSYRNTNYLLLALMADEITGDHARYMDEVIFKPLALTQTFYRNDPGYLKYQNLVNCYWDRYGNSILENVSQMQRNNVSALVGDDGIVATPVDAVKFLRGLINGDLLSPATLALMKTWVNNKDGKPAYGLGLTYATFQGETAYGHSGGGIGAGCQLYYFPDKDLYMFIGINFGTVTDSPIHEKAGKTLEMIHSVLLK